MENLEIIESNLVISLITLAMKKKRKREKHKKKQRPYKTNFDILPFVWLSLEGSYFHQHLGISSSHLNYIDHSFAISNHWK